MIANFAGTYTLYSHRVSRINYIQFMYMSFVRDFDIIDTSITLDFEYWWGYIVLYKAKA